MAKDPANIKKALQQRRKNGLFRTLPPEPKGIDFISNDYLGFARLNLLREPEGETGSTGSRLISGNSDFKMEMEEAIAKYHKAPASLFFNSGYNANIGLFSCVPQKNDLVITDELIHASVHDGIRLSYAKHYKFRHNDINDLEDLLQRHSSSFGNIYVAVESVYSMDGDEAPLRELIILKKKHKNVFLIVDEAHAIGVFGMGLCKGSEKEYFARIYTYGKATGCHGAAIVGSKDLKNYLINFSRSFIYTTALPDVSISSICSAYFNLETREQQKALKKNIAYFTGQVKEIKGFIKSRSAIQCMVLGNNKSATQLEKN
jgi:8-amino-7-oxononanoate synthase